MAIDSVREEAEVYGKVFLAGAVRAPGPIALDPTEHLTVSNIILKAGGFAQFAASNNVRVTRKQKNGEKQTSPWMCSGSGRRSRISRTRRSSTATTST